MSIRGIAALNPKLFGIDDEKEWKRWLEHNYDRDRHEWDYPYLHLEGEKETCRWIALRKEVLPDSTLKSLEDQYKLVPCGQYIPTANEVAWVVSTYYETRGIWLFDSIKTRTRNFFLSGSGDDKLYFGVGTDYSKNKPPYLAVGYYYGDRPTEYGLATALNL